jgi:hypothetical protein
MSGMKLKEINVYSRDLPVKNDPYAVVSGPICWRACYVFWR